MKLESGNVAIVTGASRGLGVFMARALARKGCALVLAARSNDALVSVAQELEAEGTETLAVVTDVSKPQELQGLVNATIQRFGRIDVLVNNAGYDYALPYDQTELADILGMVEVNLTAPMMLTRLVLPEMLKRGRGHIVNIASLAGVMPSAYEELYTATKHGLVGFTRSLRASARDSGWPVSASVICPGFMEDAGLYEQMKKDYGVNAPAMMGSTRATDLGDAVVRAIEKDIPDILIMKGSPRLAVAALALAPRLFESINARMDTGALFRAVAKKHVQERNADGE